jgi:hypothetical protein
LRRLKYLTGQAAPGSLGESHLRDGNQALAEPMDPDRKYVLFSLVTDIGFKEIEISYPRDGEGLCGTHSRMPVAVAEFPWR